MRHSKKTPYKGLFENAPDAVIAVNQAGRVARVNCRAEALFGYDRKELLGRPLEFLAPDHHRAAYADLLSIAESKLESPWQHHIVDLPGRNKSGDEFPLQITLSLVQEVESLIVLAIRNVTQQKQAQEELLARERQQAAVSELGRRALTGMDLLQLMREAVDLVHSNLKVSLANVLELLPDGTLMFRAGTGWKDGIVGQAMAEPGRVIPAAEVLLSQAPVIVEDLRTDERFPDASLLREHGAISSLNVPLYGYDRPFGVLGAYSTCPRRFRPEDVSFLQSVANILSAALERDCHERLQRERYLQRAEQMIALGQVAAGVAHELRNPLTAIKGLIQVNLRKATAYGVPSADLAVIEHEIRRMERTLQTFLDFARPPEPNRCRFGLVSIVGRVLALVKGRAQKQSVELRMLRPDSPVQVEADQDQLQQLFLNLVLNALDAMPGGGTLEIDLRPPRDGQVEVYIRDTGPGISPYVLSKVFETFVSSKETGVGLGLPVSRRIAEEHGGSLSAYNLPGTGACFLLRLPAL